MTEITPPTKEITIATHSGSFHLDDIVAIAILNLYSKEANVTNNIVRTRDLKLIENSDIKVDVGSKYNPVQGYYDHHQKEGAGIRSNGTPYASAGLIWKHLGESLGLSKEAHQIVDKKLIEFVDSIDTGTKNHGDETYTLYELIRGFNYRAENKGSTYEEEFQSSTKIAELVLENEIMQARDQANTNQLIRKLLPEFENKPYVVLPDAAKLLWQDVLVNETDKSYAIFSDDSSIRVRCIPTEVNGFNSRIKLPKEWAGLPTEKLISTSKISDAVFCHPGRFIAGTKTISGAINMAEKAYLGGKN